MCCGGDQSGRQLIQEEDEDEDDIEYYWAYRKRD